MYIQFATNEVEWDPGKAASNLRKHGVDFADAAMSLADSMAITLPDPDAEGEERYVTMAMDPTGILLITVYAYVGENIRIISSRKASRGERRSYEER